jgi:hypothetical protein
MPQSLWVEYKTDEKEYIHRIPLEDCDFVADFIEKIKNNTQFSVIKNSEITLHGPSGTAIRPTEPISVLIPGNSTENPLRVQVSAPLPVSVKPAPDAELTSFWNSLHGLQDREGFLYFPVKPEFFQSKFKALYIRRAYGDLFNIICENSRSADPMKQFSGMAITGTPGIGKSMFLFYILWRLANLKITEMAILHRRSDRGSIYVFQNDGCWVTSNLDSLRRFLKDPATWYLTDALLQSPDESKAVTIVVSSPAEKYYSEFLNAPHVALLHYLPVWSLDELNLAAPLYERDEDVVKKRFAIIGGIPRYVLEKDVDLKAMIKHKMKKLMSNNVGELPSAEEPGPKDISHRLVHFKVDPPRYTECELIMASEYVRGEFIGALHYQEERYLLHLLLMIQDIPVIAFLGGQMFERYANRQLSAGGEFLVRSLDDESEKMVNFPATSSRPFEELSECTNPNIYYRPARHNFPSIDSLVVGIGYFQMTLSLVHRIKWNQMKGIKDVMKMENFYFVVPRSRYREFKKQTFIGGPTNRNIPTASLVDPMSNIRLSEVEVNRENEAQLMRVTDEWNSERHLIRQYVIGIPITEEAASWISKAEQSIQIVQQGRNEGDEQEE